MIPLLPNSQLFPVILLALAWVPGSGIPGIQATDSQAETRESSEETISSLPAWEEGDCQEGFEVRIWPEKVILWLEQENLRDLIADPGTPEAEKAVLRRILAMQRVWPKRL